jgi:hypothetical protein
MRRYDKRQFNGRKPNQQKPGPKPLYLKHLSRNSAAKTLKAFEAIASLAQIYQRAWDKGNEALCAQLWLRCEDRLYGKPFTAENPEAKGKSNPLFQDNRLQVAINTLLPPKARAGAQQLPRTRPKALPAAVDAQPKPGEPTERD